MFCLSLAWLVGAELSFVASGCRLLSDGNEFHRSLIDLPQKRVTKVERPDPVFDLFQGDVLSCQDFRDEHELAEELDFPLVSNGTHLHMSGILRLRKKLWHSAP